MKKIMVVLATYGEVEDPTIKNLLPNSRRIIEFVTSQVADLSRVMRMLISYFRSFKRSHAWKKAGYRSRLVKIHKAQTALVAKRLNVLKDSLGEKLELDIKDAYYFVPPYFEDVIASHDAYDATVVFSMFPIESAFSCGVACKMVRDTWGDKACGKLHVIGSTWNDDELLRIYIDHIFTTLAQYGVAKSSDKKGLVLAVHGTLVRDSNGNPPKVPTGFGVTMKFYEKLRAGILADPRSNFTDIKLGCLNHKYGGTWTPDTVERAFEEFKTQGIESVSLFPFGFFADNSEVDFEAKRKMEAAGFKSNYYIHAINDSPVFAEWVAGKIYAKLYRIIGIENAVCGVREKA